MILVRIGHLHNLQHSKVLDNEVHASSLAAIRVAIWIEVEAAVPYEEAETVTHEQSLTIECSPDFSASQNSTSSIAPVCRNGSFYDSENSLLEDIETQLQCFALAGLIMLMSMMILNLIPTLQFAAFGELAV